MICAACGNEIDRLVISLFDLDGSDYQTEVTYERQPENAVVFETTPNWTAYDLSEYERLGDIRCPHCGGFPFNSKEIQLYDIVRVVLFADQANRDPDAHAKKVPGLVSRDCLIKYLRSTSDVAEFLLDKNVEMDEIIDRIQELPEADAVEVVRCIDCLYRSQYSNDEGLYGCGAHEGELFQADHFCAYGERRT